MNKKLITIIVIIASIAITAGVARAAGMTADWLKVGTQGEGGVTFFNGTIINETTGDNDANNPVTFGDNVRIDGRVYRGATAGISDTLPFIVNDNMEVTGTLAVGNVTATGFTGSGIISSDNLASSAVTSVKIADGTVVTADLADNAVTQGVEDNNPTVTTTLSGTSYDTAAEISITTGDSPVFCMFSGYGTTDAINQSIKIALIVDDVIQVNSYRSATMGDGVGHIILSTNGIYTMAAGAHTIQLGWNTDVGATASLYFNTLDCIELKK
ncbi:hypothetical protein KKF61_00370 [Patescibacteria group bacterium]|nr:hypothetical protein [Patescibacteria group bacterium]MBU0964200.1 hypothetical protein [Patescibacteria group bacterium]